MQSNDLQASFRQMPTLRLVIGLAQGLYLLLLYQAAKAGVWPATNLYAFLPLVQLGLYLPLAAIVSLGHVSLRALLMWLGALGVLIAGLDLHAIYAFNMPVVVTDTVMKTVDATDEAAVIALFIFMPIGLLIAHTLFVARQTLPGVYETYFELAWKHGIQVAASGAFTGVFWLLLSLGIGLFKLIRIDAVGELFRDARFAIPATAVVVALALHITDVRAGIITGMRALALTLLSWLLPVLVVLIVSFLVALPFAGIDLLWDTNFATSLLLAAAAALIVLINAVYQDGPVRAPPPKVLVLVGSAGAVALVSLAVLAGTGLGLRVAQYGWTGDRIVAAACVVVAAGYAGGYAYSVFRPGAWMQLLERVNVAMSYVVLAVLIALFSPLADPSRISVNSQVARLKDGRIGIDAFDFEYLRFDAGRYGVNALNALAADPAIDPALKQRAVAALERTYRSARPSRDIATAPEPVRGTALAANIEVLTPGKTLPESFLAQTWTASDAFPDCAVENRCKAALMDLNRDGADEVILFAAFATYVEGAQIYQQVEAGWRRAGALPSAQICLETLEALRAGLSTTVPSAWDGLQIGGHGVDVLTNLDGCPLRK